MLNKYARQVLNIQSNNTLAPYHILQQWITPLSQRQMIHEINVDVINNDIYIRMQSEHVDMLQFQFRKEDIERT